jgi:subtilisin family serine protease
VLAKVEELGVSFSRKYVRNGEADHLGGVYPAWIPWEALDALTVLPGLRQIDSEYLRRRIPPLDVTRPLTGVPALERRLFRETDLGAGHGVKITDWDSGIDPYHPSFFRADGGYFPWIDVNGDGQMTFGVDAVDLDGDGQPGEDEILRYHDVARINFYDPHGGWDEVLGNNVFEPDLDWVYADTNGNGRRDYGPDNGFDDRHPTFGEPIFLVDDVNGNGRLDPEERLVALGTSKIEKVLVYGKEYVRGTNLSELTANFFGGDEAGYPAALHGTGVSGILVGNQPGFSRYAGMAPEAKLYLIDYSRGSDGDWTGTSDLARLLWAREQGTDILLYEFSMWGMTFMDGSSNLEMAMDSLSKDDGVFNVVPAGNLAGAGKHMETDLEPGDSEVTLELPETWPGYSYYAYETPALIVTFYWKGAPSDMSMAVAVPGHPSVPLEDSMYQSQIVAPGMEATCYASKGGAGFSMRMCYVWDSAQVAVPNGIWTWTVTNHLPQPLPVHGFLMDYVSSWSRIPVFLSHESDATTLCHPSTADSAISVAAFGGRFGPPQSLGVLRDYSSRGPRMDGPVAIDIAAPDDPYTALAQWDTSATYGMGVLFGAYSVFGGTSGAGPHVAGALALLKQKMKGAAAQDVRDALLTGVDTGEFMGPLPNPNYGHGKLNIYRSAYGDVPPDNQPPVARLAPESIQGLYVRLTGAGSTDPEGDGLQYRFDLNYDGKWDTGWSDDPAVELGVAEASRVTVKMQVRDEVGNLDAVLLVLDLDPSTVWPIPEPDPETKPESSEEVISHPEVVQETHSSKDSVPGDSSHVSPDPEPTDLDELPVIRRTGSCATSPGEAGHFPWWMVVLAVLVVGCGARMRRSPRPARNSLPICREPHLD